MDSFRTVLVLFVILLIMLMVLWWYQSSKLFYPITEHVWTPAYSHRELWVKGLSAWYFDEFPGRSVILFCHGNTGNISHREYVVELCHRLKINLLIFDYAGFGKSLGTPDPQRVCNDAQVFYDWLREEAKIECKNIVVWGESLGGGAAVWVASRNECSCLLLLSTFSSLCDVAIAGEPVWKQQLYKLSFYLMNDIPNVERIKNVKCPVAILHSPEDDIIPYECCKKLYAAVPTKKIFIEIHGKHSQPHITVANLRSMFEFACIEGESCELVADILKQIEEFSQQHERKIVHSR